MSEVEASRLKEERENDNNGRGGMSTIKRERSGEGFAAPFEWGLDYILMQPLPKT
jgi:hypothetical protein